MKELAPPQQQINDLMKHVSLKRSQWLLSTLYYVLNVHNISENERLLWTDEILNGFVDSIEKNQFNKNIQNTHFYAFLTDINDYNVMDMSVNKRKSVSLQKRSPGDSAQVRYVKYRSSFAPVKMNTVIDFKYNSIQPTPKGQIEYLKALSVFKSNTTKSVLIVGHASPKGDADYNCKLSKDRAITLKNKILKNTNLDEYLVIFVWAGENIPLDLGQAKKFIKRDIQTLNENYDDPMRRRVEFEINGQTLLNKYAGKLCN